MLPRAFINYCVEIPANVLIIPISIIEVCGFLFEISISFKKLMCLSSCKVSSNFLTQCMLRAKLSRRTRSSVTAVAQCFVQKISYRSVCKIHKRLTGTDFFIIVYVVNMSQPSLLLYAIGYTKWYTKTNTNTKCTHCSYSLYLFISSTRAHYIASAILSPLGCPRQKRVIKRYQLFDDG